MSLDQSVACRRAPNLPADLPQPERWAKSMFENMPVHTFNGQAWLVNVIVEPEFPEDMLEQLAEDLADVGNSAEASDHPVLVSVSLDPVTRDQSAIGLQTEILEMLIETCDGIVLAN